MDDELRQQLAQARELDPDAWEAMFRRSYARLIAYADRRVGPDAADDIVSEAMTRAVATISDHPGTAAGVDGWLTALVRDVVREAGGSIAWPRPSPRPPVAGHQPGDVEPRLLELAQRDDGAVVRDAFSRLDPADRELLELRYLTGLDAAGVGEVLGQRSGAVRIAASRALHQLRAILAESPAGGAGADLVARLVRALAGPSGTAAGPIGVPADRVARLRAEVQAARTAAQPVTADAIRAPHAVDVSNRVAVEPVPMPADPAPATPPRSVAAAVPSPPPTPRRGRRQLLAGLATGLIAGVAAGATGRELLDDPDDDAPSESLALSITAPFVASARLVDREWGTELALEGNGFIDGLVHRVRFRTIDDQLVDAGGFVGAGARHLTLRATAPVRRDELVAVEVVDPDEMLLASAALG